MIKSIIRHMSKEKKIRLSGYIPESVKDKVVTRTDEKHEGNKNKALIELINRGYKELTRKRK